MKQYYMIEKNVCVCEGFLRGVRKLLGYPVLRKILENICGTGIKNCLGLTWMKVGFLLKMSRLVPHVCPCPKVAFFHSSLTGADYASMRL